MPGAITDMAPPQRTRVETRRGAGRASRRRAAGRPLELREGPPPPGRGRGEACAGAPHRGRPRASSGPRGGARLRARADPHGGHGSRPVPARARVTPGSRDRLLSSRLDPRAARGRAPRTGGARAPGSPHARSRQSGRRGDAGRPRRGDGRRRLSRHGSRRRQRVRKSASRAGGRSVHERGPRATAGARAPLPSRAPVRAPTSWSRPFPACHQTRVCAL